MIAFRPPRLRAAALSAGLCAAALAPVAAQRADASSVSLEFLTSFLRMYLQTDSTAQVQYLPDGMPPAVAALVPVPPNSHILGTVVVGKSSYVLGTSPLPKDSVFAWYAREFMKRKWPADLLVRLQFGAVGGGFRPAPTTRPTNFCGEGNAIDLAAIPSGDATTFRVRVVPNGFPCTPPPGGFRPRTPAAPLPLLTNPPNRTVTSQCFVTASAQRTSTPLATELTPAELIAHYGTQLGAQGWAPIQGDYPIARRSWSRRDSTGVTEVTTLTTSVMPTAPMCRDASLEVVTLRSR